MGDTDRHFQFRVFTFMIDMYVQVAEGIEKKRSLAQIGGQRGSWASFLKEGSCMVLNRGISKIKAVGTIPNQVPAWL